METRCPPRPDSSRRSWINHPSLKPSRRTGSPGRGTRRVIRCRVMGRGLLCCSSKMTVRASRSQEKGGLGARATLIRAGATPTPSHKASTKQRPQLRLWSLSFIQGLLSLRPPLIWMPTSPSPASSWHRGRRGTGWTGRRRCCRRGGGRCWQANALRSVMWFAMRRVFIRHLFFPSCLLVCWLASA